MQETPNDHHTSITVGGRSICNLRFAGDINLMGGSNSELQHLTNRLVDKARAIGMEVGLENSEIMTFGMNDICAYINTDGQKLE